MVKTKEITGRCPFCGKNGTDCTNLMVKKVRDSTTILICENLHLWGRGT